MIFLKCAIIAMKLTITEIATALSLPVSTIERWIRQGKIPIQKDGSGRYIHHTVLGKWAAAHHLSCSLPASSMSAIQTKLTDKRPADVLLSAMETGGVFYKLRGGNIKAVLKEAVGRIPLLSPAAREILLEKLIEREQTASTGIGKGAAVPHTRTPFPDIHGYTVVSTCFLEEPVDFGSVDHLPVFVLFIVLCDSSKLHLDLLSRLAFCLRDNEFVSFLRTSPSSDALFESVYKLEIEYQGVL